MNILELKLKLGEQNSLLSENPCLDSTKWKMDLGKRSVFLSLAFILECGSVF